jgi:hypothetical protein
MRLFTLIGLFTFEFFLLCSASTTSDTFANSALDKKIFSF